MKTQINKLFYSLILIIAAIFVWPSIATEKDSRHPLSKSNLENVEPLCTINPGKEFVSENDPEIILSVNLLPTDTSNGQKITPSYSAVPLEFLDKEQPLISESSSQDSVPSLQLDNKKILLIDQRDRGSGSSLPVGDRDLASNSISTIVTQFDYKNANVDTAFIAGVAGDFGKALTKIFLKQGINVIGVDQNNNALNKLFESNQKNRKVFKDTGELKVIAADFSEMPGQDSIVPLVKRFLGKEGKLKYGIFNFVGKMPSGDNVIETAGRREIRACLENNYVANVMLTHHLLPLFQRDGGGSRLVYISSNAGTDPSMGAFFDATTKGALDYFVRALRVNEPVGKEVLFAAVNPSKAGTNIHNRVELDENSNNELTIAAVYTQWLLLGATDDQFSKYVKHEINDVQRQQFGSNERFTVDACSPTLSAHHTPQYTFSPERTSAGGLNTHFIENKSIQQLHIPYVIQLEKETISLVEPAHNIPDSTQKKDKNKSKRKGSKGTPKGSNTKSKNVDLVVSEKHTSITAYKNVPLLALPTKQSIVDIGFESPVKEDPEQQKALKSLEQQLTPFMPSSKPRKIAFITGISRGIGKAITERFLMEGVDVIGLARDPILLNRLIEENTKVREEQIKAGKTDTKQIGELKAFVADLSMESGQNAVSPMIKMMLGEYEKLTYIILNAAVIKPLGYNAIVTAMIKDIRACLEINYIANVMLTHDLLPYCKRDEGGSRILYVSSKAGTSPSKGTFFYATTKGALDYFVKVLRFYGIEKKGVLSAVWNPGNIETDIHKNDLRGANLKGEEEEKFLRENPRALHFRSMEGKLTDVEIAAQHASWLLLEATIEQFLKYVKHELYDAEQQRLWSPGRTISDPYASSSSTPLTSQSPLSPISPLGAERSTASPTDNMTTTHQDNSSNLISSTHTGTVTRTLLDPSLRTLHPARKNNEEKDKDNDKDKDKDNDKDNEMDMTQKHMK
jgi:NAD(P)-dependent dehydrogenase (short-subunit alcohol dehydrogenase family)